MPAKSPEQKRLMDAAAHNPAFAKKVGIPTKVAQEFSTASKGQKFGSGAETRADRQSINKPKTDHGQGALFKKGGETMATKKPNPFAKFEKSGKDVEVKGKGKEGSKKEEAFDRMQMAGMKKGGGVKKMANGGITSAKMGSVKAGGVKGKGEHAIQSKGISKGTMVKMSGSKPLGMKKGGKC